MVAFDVNDLKKFAPHANADILALFMTAPQELADAGILANPKRLCHFLAQVTHETGGFTAVTENLNYSAEQLMRTWHSRFPTEEIANQYAHQKEKIANFVYGGRMGNTADGDGYKYRGRGLLQLTGKDNYAHYGEITQLPLVDNPDLVTDPASALKVAALFWKNARNSDGKTCNELADEDNIRAITHLINGGENGLADRTRWLEKAQNIWAPAAAGAAVGAAAGAAASATANSAPASAPVAPPAPPPPPPPAPQPQAQQPQTQQPQAQAPAQPSTQSAPQPAPQSAPRQAPGTTISAIIAFFAGAIAFLNSLFEQVRAQLHAWRVQIINQYHVDILWIAAGIFVLAILIIIVIRMHHKGAVKKAVAA